MIELFDRLVSGGTFPLLDSSDLIGGYMQVETIADRDNIAVSKRRNGMLVYVQSEDNIYKLKKNGQWELLDIQSTPMDNLPSVSSVDDIGNLLAYQIDTDALVKLPKTSITSRLTNLDSRISIIEQNVGGNDDVSADRYGDVVTFDDFVNSDIHIETMGTGSGSATPECEVVFSTIHQKLLLAIPTGSGETYQYYSQWSDNDRFALSNERIYICKTQNKLYRWDGTNLSALGATDVTLGTAAGEAYPGTAGATLASRVSALESGEGAISEVRAEIETISDDMTSLTSRISTLENRCNVVVELASEEEWQRRKNAGELEAGKLYFVAEE